MLKPILLNEWKKWDGEENAKNHNGKSNTGHERNINSWYILNESDFHINKWLNLILNFENVTRLWIIETCVLKNENDRSELKP